MPLIPFVYTVCGHALDSFMYTYVLVGWASATLCFALGVSKKLQWTLLWIPRAHQTPHLGLHYLFTNHCRSWLHQRSLKTVSYLSDSVFFWCFLLLLLLFLGVLGFFFWGGGGGRGRLVCNSWNHIRHFFFCYKAFFFYLNCSQCLCQHK